MFFIGFHSILNSYCTTSTDSCVLCFKMKLETTFLDILLPLQVLSVWLFISILPSAPGTVASCGNQIPDFSSYGNLIV